MLLTKFCELVGLSVQEKKQKTDFQNGRHSDRNNFSNILQVALMLPTKFQIKWLFKRLRRREK